MNILSIIANKAVSDFYIKDLNAQSRMQASLPSTVVRSYNAAFSELRINRFKYDVIITSFTPNVLLTSIDAPIDQSARDSDLLSDRAQFYGEGGYYSRAYQCLNDILSNNPFSVVVVYSGGDSEITGAANSRFRDRIGWVLKDEHAEGRVKLQHAILEHLTEYRVTIDNNDKFQFVQVTSRSPFMFHSEAPATEVFVKPHFSSSRIIYMNQLRELEFLINKSNPSEHEIQLFLEAHPEMLLGDRYKTLRSHVHLQREDEGKGPLIPDFILEPVSPTDFWKIIDLKLPSERIVSESSANRIGFGAKVFAALRQLREYRDYFDNSKYRERLADIGISAFKPQIGVIIGRDYGGLSLEEIVKSKLDFQGMEVLTYTELLARVKEMTWM